MISPLVAALLSAIAASPPSSPGDADGPTPDAIRASVQKALPLLLRTTAEYPRHRDCFSCHHQAIPAIALSAARKHGFAVEAEAIDAIVELTMTDLRGALASYKEGRGQGGGITRAGYALWTLEVGEKRPDEVTEAVASFLLNRDERRDHWRTSSRRPPSEASDFTATAVALRALSVYGTAAQKGQIASRAEKARLWLEKATPRDTEDRVGRLYGLKAASAPPEAIRSAVDDLLKARRDDGGWSQGDEGASDAYATGSALVALTEAGGLPATDPAYRKGLSFLIATQKDDGSWFVASRSTPFQPYFESGFPYKKDQFISTAATAWAATALALACPKP